MNKVIQQARDSFSWMTRAAQWTLLPLLLVVGFLATLPLAFAHPGDAGSAEGEWQLRDGQRRFTLTLNSQPGGGWTGMSTEAGQSSVVDQITWEPSAGVMSFRERGSTRWSWYRGRIVEGVIKGRVAYGAVNAAEPGLGEFDRHVTGWNSSHVDVDIVPRVFDLVVNGHYRARLRIDRDVSGSGFAGRFKVYANDDPSAIAVCETTVQSFDPGYDRWPNPLGLSPGAACEEQEWDVDVSHWDGDQINFARSAGSFWQNYSGTVTGRLVQGTFTQADTPLIMNWRGARAEVLGAGFQAHTANEDPADWRHRTRSQLAHLKMAGNPQPLASQVNVLRADLPPQSQIGMPSSRDDDPGSWPQKYRLQEIELLHTLANPYGSVPLQRRDHGYLATPNDGQSHIRPAVIVLNGHGGSAWRTMDPRNQYWYGDSFARRGYVVLALDVSHRSHADDADNGNGIHPPIAAPGFSTDWEEDGERVWSVMRAVDYLLQRSDVDPNRLVIAGLSMGGEVAALAAAMDTRIRTAVIAGYTPDFNVMAWSVNHDCWQWRHADIREYVDMSDYLSLISPRRVIALTGKLDAVFSLHEPPFSADKQVMRRTLALSPPQGPRPIHYLHDDGHAFRVGDRTVGGDPAQYIQVPLRQGPSAPWEQQWQYDDRTTSLGKTLYDVVGDGQDTLFIGDFDP